VGGKVEGRESGVAVMDVSGTFMTIQTLDPMQRSMS
jgi:hypothetical protein